MKQNALGNNVNVAVSRIEKALNLLLTWPNVLIKVVSRVRQLLLTMHFWLVKSAMAYLMNVVITNPWTFS